MDELEHKHPYAQKELNIPQVELKYVIPEDFPKNYIHDTQDIQKVCSSIFDLDAIYLEGRLYVIYLKRNLIISHALVSIGSTTKAQSNIRKILSGALVTFADAMIICHNHTSGSTNPSAADKVQTQQLFRACNFLDISLLDHIIFDPHNYYSFADSGELYKNVQ